MIKKSGYSLICLLFLLFGWNASEAGNFYIGGFGGATWVSDSDVSGMEDEIREEINGNIENLSLEQSFDTGYVFGGNVGYDFGYFRTEAEISYRKNDLDQLEVEATVDGLSFSVKENSRGDASALSFMANCFFEYDNETRFIPYAGGGIGFSRAETDNDISDDDTVFAYQLGAGLAFKATEKIILELSYRYFGTSDSKFENIKVEYSTHNVLFGLRYNF